MVKSIIQYPFNILDSVKSYVGKPNQQVIYGVVVVCGVYTTYVLYKKYKTNTEYTYWFLNKTNSKNNSKNNDCNNKMNENGIITVDLDTNIENITNIDTN